MTIMALAAQRPDLFLAGGRVAGVALVGTSAGKLAQVSLGLPAAVARLTQGITPKVWIGLGKRGTFVDARRQRGMGSDIGYALTRRLSFGDKNVSPILVEIMERMINATSAEVISAFAPAFLSHDKLAALANLRDIPVLVLNGSADVLTPPDHSDAIVAELPDAEHVVVQGAGHMVMMEQPELTNSHLRSLVSRSFAARVG
jgi:pimeloyl-ACP methyl ester carboxylesterase